MCLFSSSVGWLEWSGDAILLGKHPVPGRPTIWITVGQGPTALAVGVGGGCLDIFSLIFPFFPLSPSLWETTRNRLKYCLKGPLNPKQPTNQPGLVGCFFGGAQQLFERVFQPISGRLTEIGRKKIEMIHERKNAQKHPSAPTVGWLVFWA